MLPHYELIISTNMQPIFDIIHDTPCCGHRIIDGISVTDILDVVYTVGVANRDGVPRKNGAFYSFTDNTFDNENDIHYGDELRDFIVSNNLGVVTSTDAMQNPNSGRRLKLYTWQVNLTPLVDWCNREDNAQRTAVEALDLHVGDCIRYEHVARGLLYKRVTILHIMGRDIEVELPNGHVDIIGLVGANVTKIRKI